MKWFDASWPWTIMSHIHLCFQTRMSDESQMAPHPRLQSIKSSDNSKCNKWRSHIRGGQCHQKQNEGEHRESNSVPRLPESRIIPLDHAPLTGGNVERPLQWATCSFLPDIKTLLTQHTSPHPTAQLGQAGATTALCTRKHNYHCLLQRAEHIILRRCSSSLLQSIRCCACTGSRVRGNCDLTCTCTIVQHTQVAIATQIVNKYQGKTGHELDVLSDLIR